ncbi:MAG: branched-chain amino acid ABC transporter permease [Lachnospiraceae bacterium]|nr:branched-chain amino acid ABC transporter permease [Lachnospiraceae bacterium]
MNRSKVFTPRAIALTLLLAALLIAPFVMDGYMMQIAVYCGIYVMLAASLNLLIGYTGIFSMGHVAFYCLGAYTSSLLATKMKWSFIWCFLAAGIVAGIAGALVGIATLRLNDLFLTFATMGLSEVVRIVIQNAKFTNGALGVTGIPQPAFFGISIGRTGCYYLTLAMVLLSVFVIYRLVHSNTGRTLMTIRDDAGVAASLGINVFAYKMKAMIISCFIAGLAGSIYASFVQYINASNFSLNVSINIVAMVAIGGMGTISGPIIGAVLLQILPEAIRFLDNYRQLLFGAALVISVMFAPKGLVGLPWSKLGAKLRPVKKENS